MKSIKVIIGKDPFIYPSSKKEKEKNPLEFQTVTHQKIKCNLCHQKNDHSINNCPFIYCVRCGQRGHSDKICFK